MAEGTPLSRVRSAYEQLLAGSVPADGLVRSLVRDSWQRSLGRGLRTDGAVSAEPMADDELAEYLAAHPLAPMIPLIESLIVDDIAEAGVVVSVADRHGRLLWIDGDTAARDKAAAINFVEGTVWSEESAGTNAPGLALTTGQGVQIRGPEHFAEPVQDWNCAAAPVHDPISGELLGVIDVTGGDAAAAPFALSTVRSVVAAVERELRSRAVDLSAPSTFHPANLSPRRSAPSPAAAGPLLEVLADDGPHWSGGGQSRHPLSRRHGEILLLLHSYPEGLSTEQLAAALSEEEIGAVTVRAEISRLRRDLGDIVAARPYRLTVSPDSDAARLKKSIADGALTDAVAGLGRGGLLAESLAPGVVEIFEELREDLRSRLLSVGDPAALQAWTGSPHGRDDLAAWQALALRLPVDDPQQAIAAGRIRLLDRRFGLG